MADEANREEMGQFGRRIAEGKARNWKYEKC